MNRLSSCSAATLAALWLLAVHACCAWAGDYLVSQVSDFTFVRSPGGGLDFKDPWQIGNQLFFRSTSSNGSEIYRTDGNSVTEYDLNLGPGRSSVPTWFHIWRNSLYFAAFSNDLGWELYSTSGDAPQLIADIAPGPESSSPGHHSGFAELGDYLYFFAGVQGDYGLYRTSGEGVEFVAPSPQDSLRIFNRINDLLIFSGAGENGEEFYRTDGHTVSLLADVNPGPAGSNPQFLYDYDGFLYFKATGPNGTELFRTDGATVTEIDISPGPASSDPNGRVVFKDELYFRATGSNGGELFKTNGTSVTEFDVNPGPSGSRALVGYHAIVGDRFYFAATVMNGQELFATDGVSVREFDINPGSESSNPLFFKVAGGALYFQAQGPQGKELYKAQGDEVTLIDLNPGPASSNPQSSTITELNGSVYLSAVGTLGVELFRVDGENAAGFDIFPGERGSYPQSFIVFNDELFVSAMGPNGRAVYRTNGTTIEEVFNPDPRAPALFGVDSRITGLVSFGNSLVFIAETSRGAHLYRLVVVPEPSSFVSWSIGVFASFGFVVMRGRLARFRLSPSEHLNPEKSRLF